jgi:phosphoglycolate phosphatase-like HAD superfamily hydrolase
MVMPAAVLFDLDGTLIDTTDLILASCQHTFERHLKAGCPPRQTLIATFGRSLPESLLEIAVAEGAEDPGAFAAESRNRLCCSLFFPYWVINHRDTENTERCVLELSIQ